MTVESTPRIPKDRLATGCTVNHEGVNDFKSSRIEIMREIDEFLSEMKPTDINNRRTIVFPFNKHLHIYATLVNMKSNVRIGRGLAKRYMSETHGKARRFTDFDKGLDYEHKMNTTFRTEKELMAVKAFDEAKVEPDEFMKLVLDKFDGFHGTIHELGIETPSNFIPEDRRSESIIFSDARNVAINFTHVPINSVSDYQDVSFEPDMVDVNEHGKTVLENSGGVREVLKRVIENNVEDIADGIIEELTSSNNSFLISRDVFVESARNPGNWYTTKHLIDKGDYNDLIKFFYEYNSDRGIDSGVPKVQSRGRYAESAVTGQRVPF